MSQPIFFYPGQSVHVCIYSFAKQLKHTRTTQMQHTSILLNHMLQAPLLHSVGIHTCIQNGRTT